MNWNKIEDGLPKAGVPLIVTVKRPPDCGEPLQAVGPVYYMKSFRTGKWGWFEFGNVDAQIGPDYFEVIAWAEYPRPYGGATHGKD